MNIKHTFYCTNANGHPDFCIEEWNKQFKESIRLGFEMKELKPCEDQCFDCMAIVGEQRLKTKKLLNNKKL